MRKLFSSVYYNPQSNYLLEPAVLGALDNTSIYSVDDMAFAHAYTAPAPTSSSDVYIDPQGRRSKHIRYANDEGTEVTLVFTYLEFVDYEGNSDAAWLLISRTY